MNSFLETIRRDWPESNWFGSSVVVAVSGGPDSVALLHSLMEISRGSASLIVAHVDHGLRGAESDGDCEFVRGLAAQYSLRFELRKREVVAGETKSASEGSLRRMRHQFLRETAEAHAAAWIATGHHADDCVETLLHHLLRGSGPLGLSSIAPVRRIGPGIQLVHPLLSLPRASILDYLACHDLEYRVDATNGCLGYTRNRIRHELLPMLRSFVGTPHLDRRLWNAAQQIREEHAFVERAATDWLAKSVTVEQEAGFEVTAGDCRDVPWVVVRQGLVQLWHACGWPLREMTASHWGRVRRLIEHAGTAHHPQRLQLPGQIQVTMRRQRVRFFRTAPSNPS